VDLPGLQPAHAHRWRATVDAVAVGIGTALADDPRLTARVEGVHHQPRHVVFDSPRPPARWTPSS
jgi:diaminohydroxyphosphoribosylaminopyrimidine deaminase/5-amino-6-(5-phosphoribosylamino)uracil reductase